MGLAGGVLTIQPQSGGAPWSNSNSPAISPRLGWSKNWRSFVSDPLRDDGGGLSGQRTFLDSCVPLPLPFPEGRRVGKALLRPVGIRLHPMERQRLDALAGHDVPVGVLGPAV